jgi:hypothetical protein
MLPCQTFFIIFNIKVCTKGLTCILLCNLQVVMISAVCFVDYILGGGKGWSRKLWGLLMNSLCIGAQGVCRGETPLPSHPLMLLYSHDHDYRNPRDITELLSQGLWWLVLANQRSDVWLRGNSSI